MTRANTYRPSIDGLRAAAILSVLGFHAFPAWVPGGFVGVDIFFVISGYLISGILLDNLQAGRFSLLDFYTRRIRRIFPALIVVLAAALGVGFVILWPGEYRHLAAHAAGGAGFVVNLMLAQESGYFDGHAATKPLLHLWSLGVEEQFYIFWPVMLWAAWTCKRHAGFLIGAIIILSFAVNIWLSTTAPVMDFYSPVSRFWELLAGAALAWSDRRGKLWTPARPWREALAMAGVALILIADFALTKDMLFPGWLALLPVAGAAAIIAAGEDTFFNRKILAHPAAISIGLISYPLYLWHWPLLSFAQIIGGEASPRWIRIAMVALAFLLAALTYQYIERPIRRGTMNKKIIFILLALMFGIGAVSAMIYVGKGFPARFADPAFAAAALDSDALTADWQKNTRSGLCHLQDPGETQHAAACIETQKPLLLLWGDSHAASLYPGLKALQEKYNFGIAQLTQAGCPPLFDLPKLTFSPHCEAINADILAQAVNLQPAVIILDAAWMHEDYPLTDAEITIHLRASIAHIHHSVPQAKLIIIGPNPRWLSPLPAIYRRSLMFDRRLPPPRLDTVDPRMTALDTDMRAQAAREDVVYLSPQDYLCDATGCLTRLDDKASSLTFIDDEHLSPATAIFLTQKFAPAILSGLGLAQK